MTSDRRSASIRASPVLISPPNVHHSPSRSGPVSLPPPKLTSLEELKKMYQTEAERTVRSATEEMTTYSAMLEERKGFDDTTLAHMRVQCDAKLSSMQLQQTSEIDRLRRQQEDQAREHEMTIRHLTQQHETNLSLIETRHKQEMTAKAAQFEEHLQLSLTKQHEEYTHAINNISTKHREAHQELETKWAEKERMTTDQHTTQLAKLRTEAHAQLRELEGTFSLEQEQQKEREIRDRTEQARSIAEKMHLVESKNLELQMHVVDLTSKLDTASAQLRAAETQHAQVKERMEHNLKNLVTSIDEERIDRKAVESALQRSVYDANSKMQEALQTYNLESQEQAHEHQQQVAKLQLELQKVTEADKQRQTDVLKQNRHMEKEMVQFREKLDQRVQEQLQALSLRHSQEMHNMQMQMTLDAKTQSNENVRAIDQAYSEKMKNLEMDSQQQISTVEAEYIRKLKQYEFETQRLSQDLASQKELSALEEQTQKKAFEDKLSGVKHEYERELLGKIQELQIGHDMALRRQESDFALKLEKDKLAFAKQCRETTQETQERDRCLMLKMEEELKKISACNTALEERRLHEVHMAEQMQDKIKADAQQAIMEISQKHIEQLRAAECENAKLREEVELRLAAAAEKYNEQMYGLDHEKQVAHNDVETRVHELQQLHTEEMQRVLSQNTEQSERMRIELDHSKAQVDQLMSQVQTSEKNIASTRRELESKTLELVESLSFSKRLEDEKALLVRDRETAFSSLSARMQMQLQTAETERSKTLHCFEQERDENNRRLLADKIQMGEAADAKCKEAMFEVTRLQAQVEAQRKQLAAVPVQSVRPGEFVELRERLAIAEEANSKLRKQLEEAQVAIVRLKGQAVGNVSATPNFSETALHDRDMFEANIERADNIAIQKIFEAEQKHNHEKQEMYNSFQTQLQEAERVAQTQLSNVGETFTQQMSQLQQLVSSLQQRLMAKDGQAQRIDQELKKAQKALSEITTIYQGREQEMLAELQNVNGLKQANKEWQAQHIRDSQQLVALQAQVQQAMTAMHSAVSDVVPKEAEIFVNPQSKQQLVTSPLQQFPVQSMISTPQKSRELQLFDSTPTKPFQPDSLSQHMPVNPSPLTRSQVQAQHAFSQQLARQQAASLKQQQQQQALAMLQSPVMSLPRVGLSGDQLAAL